MVEGEFLEVDPPRRLAYTWRPSWLEVGPTTVRIDLERRQDGTQLTWTHSGFEKYPQALEDHRGGLPTVVNWLKGFLEGSRSDVTVG